MKKLGLFAAFLVVTPWLFAQGTPGSVELTPTVGYWFGDTIGRGTTDAFDFDATIDDAPSYGLRLAYRFSDNWALDGFLARERADLVTGHDDLFGGSSKFSSMDLTTGEVGLEVSFGHRRLVPFLAGGIGAMRMEPKVKGVRGDTRFVGNLGLGFKLFFSPDVALRFDWRNHSVNTGGSDDECDWWDDCHHDREWLSFREVSLGLTFVF